MNLREADKLTADFVKTLLSPFGFKGVKSLRYQKEYDEATVSLYFENRKLSSGGFALSCNLFFRYNKLTPIFDWEGGIETHLNVPINNIDKSAMIPSDWKYETIEGFNNLQDKIESAVLHTAIPFVEKNNLLDSFYTRMLSENPSDWLTIEKTSRIVMLGACLWAVNKKDQSIRYLQEKLDEFSGSLPKYTLRIESLLQRLKNMPN